MMATVHCLKAAHLYVCFLEDLLELLQESITVATELISWLQQLNMANKSMQTVMPEDILVFLVQQWLPNHARSATNSTELIAAPNSLATAKAHLSKEFELLGRTGDWKPHSQQGNPVESLHIREFITGYKNHAAELGYQKKRGVPLEEADMIQLLQQLCFQQQTLTGIDQLLLLRDGFIFSLLWQSCFRGFNAEGIRLKNIVLPTEGSAIPSCSHRYSYHQEPNYTLFQILPRTRKEGIAMSP